MDDDRFMDLLEQAEELPPDKRQAFLEEECKDAPDVMAEILDMINTRDTYELPVALDLLEGHEERILMKLLHGEVKTSAVYKLKSKKIGGRYRVLSDEPVGTGATGQVFEGEDKTMGGKVAIKRLRKEVVDARLNMRDQFLREARILHKLAQKRHEGIPSNIDLIEEDDEVYLIMEFIDGKDLGIQLIENGNTPFPVKQVVRWAGELLDIVDNIHRFVPREHPKEESFTPIVHKDIKPGNLKVRDGRLMLIDFGFARSGTMNLSVLTPNLYGYTPGYSSREQIMGKSATVLFDIYSVGATLYALLTGDAPPDALIRPLNNDSPYDPLLRLEEVNDKVPAPLAALIHQAMDMDPTKRPQSAAEMREALNAITKPDENVIPIAPTQILGKESAVRKTNPAHRSIRLVSTFAVAGLLLMLALFNLDKFRTGFFDKPVIDEPKDPPIEQVEVATSGETIPDEAAADDTSHVEEYTPPVIPTVKPPAAAQTTVVSNFKINTAQGAQVMGNGFVFVDSTTVGVEQWNGYVLEVGNRTLSARLKQQRASQVTLYYSLNGVPQVERPLIDKETGTFDVHVRPGMDSLRIVFLI